MYLKVCNKSHKQKCNLQKYTEPNRICALGCATLNMSKTMSAGFFYIDNIYSYKC